MSDYNPMSETHRPAVRVLLSRGSEAELQPVFWGLEEEGIPVEVEEWAQGDAVALAKEASHMSPLNVGIAFDGVRAQLVLHHRDLPADQPLFVVNVRDADRTMLRRLGINAARLVKSEPLVLDDEPEPPTYNRRGAHEEVSPELFERMVQSVLAELARA
jgi:hypothetical protein